MKPRASSVSTAAASGGVTGALVVIVAWGLGLAGVVVPAEIAAAFMVVAAPIVHLVAVRLGIPDDPAPAPVPAPVPTPDPVPAPVVVVNPPATPAA